MPVAYATAYYALAVRGRMRRGEAVLVHAGSGGVGQAAIAVALHAGATVYTTVGTPDKRAFLRERYVAHALAHTNIQHLCAVGAYTPLNTFILHVFCTSFSRNFVCASFYNISTDTNQNSNQSFYKKSSRSNML